MMLAPTSQANLQTPLCCGTLTRHGRTDKVLLYSDVTLALTNRVNFKHILLSLTSEDGHEGVAKIVFRRDDTESDKLNKLGQIPLC